MHGLEVFRHQVRVSAGHLQRGVPEHLLQMEDGPAAPKIVHRECVPECVEGAARRSESEFSAKQLHIPQHVSAPQLRVRVASEQEILGRSIRLLHVAKHGLPQLETEGHNALLATFAVQRDEQIFKVNSEMRSVSASVMRQPVSSKNRVSRCSRCSYVLPGFHETSSGLLGLPSWCKL